MRRVGWLLLTILLTAPSRAGSIYSYVNESGVRVLTNLGVRRSPPPEASPVASESPVVAQESSYAELIKQSAERHGIDEDLVKAIIKVESDFDPGAISPKGCKGLMQLHPDTARQFGVTNIFDPTENIEGGVKYLRFLMEQFKQDMPKVLAAYNAGHNAVLKYGGIPPYRETQAYVKKVGTLYQAPQSQPQEDVLPVPVERVRPKIYRVVQPNGRILLTTAPVDTVAN